MLSTHSSANRFPSVGVSNSANRRTSNFRAPPQLAQRPSSHVVTASQLRLTSRPPCWSHGQQKRSLSRTTDLVGGPAHWQGEATTAGRLARAGQGARAGVLRMPRLLAPAGLDTVRECLSYLCAQGPRVLPHAGGSWRRILLLWQSLKKSWTLLGCSSRPRTPTLAPSHTATSASCTGWTACIKVSALSSVTIVMSEICVWLGQRCVRHKHGRQRVFRSSGGAAM